MMREKFPHLGLSVKLDRPAIRQRFNVARRVFAIDPRCHDASNGLNVVDLAISQSADVLAVGVKVDLRVSHGISLS
jgi:hypothetical protein